MSGPGQAVDAWLEQLTGGRPHAWQRLVSGNSRTTWAVDVSTAKGDLPLVVRTDAGDGPFSGTELTLRREATAYAAMQDRGISIPRFYGYDDGLLALASERVPGASTWDAEVLRAVLAEMGTLHEIDLDTLELPGFGRTAAAELELWATMATTRVTISSPVLDFAIEFLRDHFPGEPERTVFVHGDLGIGNSMWDGGHLTALLDWEMAHIGDPHDDLAFLTVRSALHEVQLEGFGDLVREVYVARTGLALDPERLRFWQAVGVMRNLVICLASISNLTLGKDRLVHYMLVPSLERLLAGILANIAGAVLPQAEGLPDPPALPGGDLMRELARALADLPGAIPDPKRSQAARRVRFLFGQLAETWPLAAMIAEREAGEMPASDPAERIVQLTVRADRRLTMFPKAVPMALWELADFS